MPLSTAEVRQEIIDLAAASDAEIAAIFRTMTAATAEEVRDRLLDELPGLGANYELASGSLAADWYDDLRDAAEVSGRFQAIVAPLAEDEQWSALVRWGVGPLFQSAPDMTAAQSLVQGGTQRLMANAHRNTIIESSLADRKAAGWARYGNGDTCTFCRMLIGRGAVYKDSTAKFGAHDHCNCVAGPSFDDSSSVDGFLGSSRPRSIDARSADAARARGWMADNL